ncbi:Dehydrogenase/reductase SDR family member 13-like protein 2 [Colletotrichum chlorophyti]|uniref:Dehydrogenase/reductase SDR family member 13-like protein 2 n=1 Tax=Colletotrichum chlorophyti TaxID=708187 RepID=A0A1Q8RB06_9PEZI|nr:Dehydrogenase/reductase SDR family member 13-like protein 2 [Colletotrichum chlorophyti]
MTSSIDLPPVTDGAMKVTMKSFCTKARMPPDDLSLAGQTAIVTGANAGLGLTCARMMLEHKLSHLIITVRSKEKGEAAATTLRDQHPTAKIEVWMLDMLSYQSIQDFANRCSTLSRIDVVILNAGMVRQDFHLSPTGHEEIFQVNYLSTALLAILLLPVLKPKKPAKKPARLTIVNSGTSLMAKFPEHEKESIIAGFDDEKIFDPVDRYATSKLVGHLFIIKLVEYAKKEDVVVNLVDPGLCKGTGLHRHLNGGIRAIFTAVKAVTARSLEEGASTYLDAALVRGEETHGSYLMDWDIYPFAPFVYTEEGKTSRERLWDETLQELEFAGVRSILDSM